MKKISHVDLNSFSQREVLSITALEAIQDAYSTAYEQLYHAIESKAAMEHFGSSPELSVCAWAVVDWLNRFRRVLEAGSGFKKNTDWYRKCVEALKPLKQIRDFMQHYDERIKIMEEKNIPILGSVTWMYREPDSNIITMTAAVDGSHVGRSVQFGLFPVSFNREGVYRIMFAFGVDYQICLSSIVDAADEFMVRFADYLDDRSKGAKLNE